MNAIEFVFDICTPSTVDACRDASHECLTKVFCGKDSYRQFTDVLLS